MLLKLALAIAVATFTLVADNAQAQKSARIHVNQDGSHTITFKQTFRTITPTSTYRSSYQQNGYSYHFVRQSQGWIRSYTKTWTRTSPGRRQDIPDGVERSIIVKPNFEAPRLKFHNERNKVI
jgi:hypothetical protein